MGKTTMKLSRWDTTNLERGEGLDADDDSGTSGDSDDENNSRQARRNVKWDPLDKERLRAYVKEGKGWQWIHKQFPSRTGAAIRTQVSLLKK
jgi:hypothetical protein